MSYSELLVALENIIIDKVATVPTVDTSAPIKNGMAAKDDCESAREEGGQQIVDLALKAVLKGTGKAKWSFGEGQNWNQKVYHGGKGGKDRGPNP